MSRQAVLKLVSFMRTSVSHQCQTTRCNSTWTADIERLCSTIGVHNTMDQWNVDSKQFQQIYEGVEEYEKRSILRVIGERCGVDHSALANAITLYSKNPAMVHEVRKASTPLVMHLLQAIGNQPGGVMTICNLRKDLLGLIKSITVTDKQEVGMLRRIEGCCRELLTNWFCLSNLKLHTLTWESPADIIQKVVAYEAVHPVRGLTDIQRRLGPHRRCFYFSHEAAPREPLMIVHVALTDHIASNVQQITKEQRLDYSEEQDDTAIYYTISSTQKGLAGIDLGNMLIKSVVRHLATEDPHIKVHSTLSPMPGFRPWVLRMLKTDPSQLVTTSCVDHLKQLTTQNDLTASNAPGFLLQKLDSDRLTVKELEPLQQILEHFAAKYLFEAKRNGVAANSVANFHLRNGAQLYRINWAGDVSVRGMNNSFGIMVNYRYHLDQVSNNSLNYVLKQEIAIHPQGICMCLGGPLETSALRSQPTRVQIQPHTLTQCHRGGENRGESPIA